jgi:hypothetical protein
MRGILLFAFLCAGLLHAGAIGLAKANEPAVDVALVLAVDISASVDEQEHRLQMIGLAAALQSDAVIAAISAAPRKRIAVAVTQWSGARAQYLLVPWVVIDGEASAKALARRLLLARRADDGGGTSISAALTHAGQLFAVAPPATRRVIDVSTDGINNVGPPLETIRSQLSAQDITVNALAIAAEWPKLADYLDERVITGTAAFTITAKSFEDFGAAMLVKLLREVRGPGLT